MGTITHSVPADYFMGTRGWRLVWIQASQLPKSLFCHLFVCSGAHRSAPCCWRSLIHVWFCFALRCVMVGIIPACRLYMRSWIFSHVQVFRRTKRGGVLMKSSTDDSIKELAKKQITEASEEKSGKQLIPSITDKSPATGCLSGIKQLILMQSRLCRVPFWSGAAAG